MRKIRLTEKQLEYCLKETALSEVTLSGDQALSDNDGDARAAITDTLSGARKDGLNTDGNTTVGFSSDALTKNGIKESYTKKQLKTARREKLVKESKSYTKKDFAKKFINESVEDGESEVSVWSFDANKFNQVTALKALFTKDIEKAIEQKGGYETMVIPEYWKQLDSNNGLTLYYDPQNEVYRFVKNAEATGNEALANALDNVPNPEAGEGKASSMVAKWSINGEQFPQATALRALFNPELLDIIEKKGGFVEQQVPSEWKPLDVCDGIRMYFDPFEKAYKFVQEEGSEGDEDIKNFFRNK